MALALAWTLFTGSGAGWILQRVSSHAVDGRLMAHHKSSAIRRYAGHLPQRAARAFGVRRSYSFEQVRALIDEWEMESAYEAWAHALLCSSDEFERSRPLWRELYRYEELRTEILAELDLDATASEMEILTASFERVNPSDGMGMGMAKGWLVVFLLATLTALFVWQLTYLIS